MSRQTSRQTRSQSAVSLISQSSHGTRLSKQTVVINNIPELKEDREIGDNILISPTGMGININNNNKALEIGISIIINSISKLNLIDNTYRISFILNTEWQINNSDLNKYNEMKSKTFIQFQPTFVPRFNLPNLIELHKKEMMLNEFNQIYNVFPFSETANIMDTNNKSTTNNNKNNNNNSTKSNTIFLCSSSCYYDCTFAGRFNLSNYPLDCQDINIIIELNSSKNICKLVPLKSKEIFFKIDRKYCSLNEYIIHEPCILFKLTDAYDDLISSNLPNSLIFDKRNFKNTLTNDNIGNQHSQLWLTIKISHYNTFKFKSILFYNSIIYLLAMWLYTLKSIKYIQVCITLYYSLSLFILYSLLYIIFIIKLFNILFCYFYKCNYNLSILSII